MPPVLHDPNVEQLESIYRTALARYDGALPAVLSTSEQGLIIYRRQHRVAVPAGTVFRTFAGLGGARGWLYANWLWHLRGLLDRIVGGIGFRKGRQHQDEVKISDTLDFFTVDAVETGRSLTLKTDFKVPGRGWLQFEALPLDSNESLFVITAFFAPKGKLGWLYWWLLYPIHAFVFSGMGKELSRVAEASPKGQ